MRAMEGRVVTQVRCVTRVVLWRLPQSIICCYDDSIVISQLCFVYETQSVSRRNTGCVSALSTTMVVMTYQGDIGNVPIKNISSKVEVSSCPESSGGSFLSPSINSNSSVVVGESKLMTLQQ